jgi:hypothetical protein
MIVTRPSAPILMNAFGYSGGSAALAALREQPLKGST